MILYFPKLSYMFKPLKMTRKKGYRIFGGCPLGDHNLNSIQNRKQLREQKCCSDYSPKNYIIKENGYVWNSRLYWVAKCPKFCIRWIRKTGI